MEMIYLIDGDLLRYLPDSGKGIAVRTDGGKPGEIFTEDIFTGFYVDDINSAGCSNALNPQGQTGIGTVRVRDWRFLGVIRLISQFLKTGGSFGEGIIVFQCCGRLSALPMLPCHQVGDDVESPFPWVFCSLQDFLCFLMDDIYFLLFVDFSQMVFHFCDDPAGGRPYGLKRRFQLWKFFAG